MTSKTAHTNAPATTGRVDMSQHQFHILDVDVKGSGPRAWNGDLVTMNDAYDSVGIADGVVGVYGPRGGGAVPVEVTMLGAAPALDLDDWSQVVEAGIHVTGRTLRLESEDDDAVLEVPISPGDYRVRVSAARLETVEYDGDTGNEHYRVQVWPGDPTGMAVLKMFQTED